nr:hypothetical protein [Deltaproteobacteria bacterium]
PAQADVFGQVGNEGMREQVEEKKRTTPVEQAPMGGALGAASAEEQKKKEELTALKKEEGPAEQPMTHRAALSEAITQLEALATDSETLKKLLKPDNTPEEAASRVLAEFAFRLTPTARAALAMADHSDLTSAMVISSTSIKQAGSAGAVTGELGTFAPIAWQMLQDAFHNVGPLHKIDNEQELDLARARRGFRPLSATWRLSLSGLAFS